MKTKVALIIIDIKIGFERVDVAVFGPRLFVGVIGVNTDNSGITGVWIGARVGGTGGQRHGRAGMIWVDDKIEDVNPVDIVAGLPSLRGNLDGVGLVGTAGRRVADEEFMIFNILRIKRRSFGTGSSAAELLRIL